MRLPSHWNNFGIAVPFQLFGTFWEDSGLSLDPTGGWSHGKSSHLGSHGSLHSSPSAAWYFSPPSPLKRVLPTRHYYDQLQPLTKSTRPKIWKSNHSDLQEVI
jgi:hypothetical protein